MQDRLQADFFSEDTLQIAQRLLGQLFVRRIGRKRLSGIIVEVEAYLAVGDPASHSYRGPGRRNAAMFQPPGTLYVYSIHAKSCMNIVTAPPGIGEAILIRGVQPWEGLESMRTARGKQALRDLCAGPARLCQALSIDTSHDQTDLLTSQHMWLESAPDSVSQRPFQVTATPRIGISTAQDALYRFFIDGHQCVSGLARQHSQPRGWLFA